MKIAHINNTAGVAKDLADEQRKHGHSAEVFVFNDIIYNQFGGSKFNYLSPISRWKFLKKIKEYDLWHYHYPYGSLKNKLEKTKNKRKYIKHYHGSDLRGKQDYDFCLVSTPDLLQYAPNGVWIPTPLDIEYIKSFDTTKIEQTHKTIKIGHYPYYLQRKHDDNYSDALNIIANNPKYQIINIMNLTHEEALKKITECDIIIGKIMPEMGWFSKFELEGMLLGKPVIAYVSDNLYEKYRPPIYNTTKDSFKQDIITFLEDEEMQEKLSKSGRQYVIENHNIHNIFDKIEKLYSKLD